MRHLVARMEGLVAAIESGDDDAIESAVLRVSRSRAWLAPLALAVSALVMLLHGLTVVFSNWRLVALMVPPTFWLWLAMYDLRWHVLYHHAYHHFYGPELWLMCAAVVLTTTAVYASNTVMVFAVSSPTPHPVGPAVDKARQHWREIAATGFVLGIVLAFSALIVVRWRPAWFTVALSIGIGLLMLGYMSGPARILGIKSQMSRKDKVVTTMVSGTISALLSLPGYAIARVGVFLMDFRPLFVIGMLLLLLGVMLHAGAGGAVKAVKVSTVLISGSGRAQ